jgi:hypothetical protein
MVASAVAAKAITVLAPAAAIRAVAAAKEHHVIVLRGAVAAVADHLTVALTNQIQMMLDLETVR